MYRSIRKFLTIKNRSKPKLPSKIASVPTSKPPPTPSAQISKKLHERLLQNDRIVIHTPAANILEERPCHQQQQHFSKSHNFHINQDSKLDDRSSLLQAIQLFHRSHSIDEMFDEETEFSTRDNEMHKFILEDVAEFYQQFSDLQTDVRILISKNVIIYVLGTNHANTQCKDDVVQIIKKVRPKTLLVELCSLRACSCKKHRSNAFQSTPKFTFRYLRTIITQLGFLPAMIFFTDVFREHLVAESSLLHYGGEFIAAMATAQALRNCRIVLADRPIEITVKRQASAMGNWRGLRVTLQVTLALMFKKRMKQLMLSANRLVFDDPKTYEVLVFERDLFLTYSIQEAAKEFENSNSLSRVVAVIGQGHMHGIQTYWGKVPSELIPLIMSPETIMDQ